MNEETNYKFTRFLELLQASVILAGGRSFNLTELANMTIGDAIHMFYPNGVEFAVRLNKDIKEWSA